MKTEYDRIIIEGKYFYLLYDYDRILLKDLTDAGKMKWFKERMNFIFINPIRLLWDRSGECYKKINTDAMPDIEHFGFNIAIFCMVLSGIESYGAFLKGVIKHDRENKPNFVEYLQKYMKEWYKNVPINGHQKHIVDLLWDNCRNAIAHGFRITDIGIGYIETEGKEMRWGIIKNVFHINCFRFFHEFVISTSCFYKDMEKDKAVRRTFLTTFNTFYPS